MTLLPGYLWNWDSEHAIGDDLVAIYLLGLFRLKQIKFGILDTAIDCTNSVESLKVMALPFKRHACYQRPHRRAHSQASLQYRQQLIAHLLFLWHFYWDRLALFLFNGCFIMFGEAFTGPTWALLTFVRAGWAADRHKLESHICVACEIR